MQYEQKLNYTLEDFIEYCNNCLKQRKKMQLVSRFFDFFIPILFGACLLFRLLNSFSGNIEIIILMVYFTLKFVHPYIYRKSLEKCYNSDKLFQEEKNLSINEDFIENHSDPECLKIEEDKICSVVEGENAFYIYLSKIKVFIIAKHNFESEEKYYELQDFVKINYCNDKIQYKK